MQVIGLLGGTGDLGRGLSVHLVNSYEKVMIGSRSKGKAVSAVQEILADKPDMKDLLSKRLVGVDNSEVASSSDIVVATLPFEATIDTIKQLKESFRGNQLFISAAASLEKKDHEFLSAKGPSVAQEIRALLTDSIEVAAAFQTVPAPLLYKNSSVDADVFVACDKKSTFEACSEVVRSIRNLRPLYVGSLQVASEVEGLTTILLNVAIKNHLRNPAFKIIAEPTAGSPVKS
jgi:8-hydroxy-5-deazaflavin:NADPH oxidoreductase